MKEKWLMLRNLPWTRNSFNSFKSLISIAFYTYSFNVHSVRPCREIVLIPFMSIVWLRWNVLIIARILDFSSELAHVGLITSILRKPLAFLTFLWYLPIVIVHRRAIRVRYQCLLIFFFILKQVRLLQDLFCPLKFFIFYVSLYKFYFFIGLGCLASYRSNNS